MTPSTLDSHASAIDEIRQMHESLIATQEKNRTLEAALAREEDRRVLLIADRETAIAEAKLYRGKLIELATAMSNIGLLTLQAQEVMSAVQTLIGPATLHRIADELEKHNDDQQTSNDAAGTTTNSQRAS